jgi:hypothetical protein
VSVTVGLDELREQVAEHGRLAFLVTVGDDGRPHIVSVTVAWEGDALVTGAGKSTSANIVRHPGVSLLWSPVAGGAYSLIVDGGAEVRAGDGETPATAAIRPSRAVLHRLVDATGDGPSCITVL